MMRPSREKSVSVVGGGLAGSEAAWQLAERGLHVLLYEMRPELMTPAHTTGLLAELVCSNSLRGASLQNAVGLLKEELRRLDSLVMQCADENRVPAGGALAVDRQAFAQCVTDRVTRHPAISLVREEVASIPTGPAVVATGPLTSDSLLQAIGAWLGTQQLAFFDAAAPIVLAESIDQTRTFRASRYDKGSDDYINCPLTEEQYARFREGLLSAEKHPLREFEQDIPFFEGCLPIEELARRGYDTLRFGPMKPVGLESPVTGSQPFAVVQLRRDNRLGTLYNMVGFQTNLRWGEQERLFRTIPGLEKAEFERFGFMHRNTFVNSPRVLLPTLQTRARRELFFAGQLTGVEGYVESTASGLVAGINVGRLISGTDPLVFPAETGLGALCRYITEADPDRFQPMNVNFGLFPPLKKRIRNKRERNRRRVERALTVLECFAATHDLRSVSGRGSSKRNPRSGEEV